MLRALLAEWGVTLCSALKLEERQKLASGLAAAVSALISGKSPPPPGLAAAASRRRAREGVFLCVFEGA